MTWKAGDRAMVVVQTVPIHGKSIGLKTSHPAWKSTGDPIFTETLHPLPDPLTELERAVVEAAERFCDDISQPCRFGLADAVRALRAARKPRDPVVELREAWKDCERNGWYRKSRERLADAIAAVEASRK